MFCTIMSTLMLASASGPKMRGGDARLVRRRRSAVILASSAAIGDAADDVLFHDLILVADEVPTAVPPAACRRDEARQHLHAAPCAAMASSTERVCSTLAPSEAISSISS